MPKPSAVVCWHANFKILRCPRLQLWSAKWRVLRCGEKLQKRKNHAWQRIPFREDGTKKELLLLINHPTLSAKKIGFSHGMKKTNYNSRKTKSIDGRGKLHKGESQMHNKVFGFLKIPHEIARAIVFKIMIIAKWGIACCRTKKISREIENRWAKQIVNGRKHDAL